MNDIDQMKQEINLQKNIAYTAGMLQSDVTIRTLLECLAEGIVIVNSDCRIVLINKPMERLFGYSQQEAIGETLDIYIPGGAQSKHNDYMRNFFAQPSIRPMGVGVELFAVTKDKVQVPVEIGISFLETEFGVLGLASVTDISARKKIERELLERNRELDEFSHIVAHDLNSNIYGIVGSGEALLDHGSDLSDEQKQEFLSYIVNAGHKMSHIIRELLLFATMKKGEVSAVAIDMEPVVEEAIARLRFTIEEKHAQISVKTPLHHAAGYAPWVEEIWLNLLSNALKYGGTPPMIEISSRQFADHVVFYVSDNGQGLALDDFEKIISHRENDCKRIVRGHGLGLEIVSRILDKLDGTLKLSPGDAAGSIFSFTLPSVKA